MPRSETSVSLSLKKILNAGFVGTQEELSDKLRTEGQYVTQSTVSRYLRRLGAVRAIEVDGRVVYRLNHEFSPITSAAMSDHIRTMNHNGALIVIHTSPGSASLVARHVDSIKSEDILGTLAGDDTVFVAPKKTGNTKALMEEIRASITG